MVVPQAANSLLPLRKRSSSWRGEIPSSVTLERGRQTASPQSGRTHIAQERVFLEAGRQSEYFLIREYDEGSSVEDQLVLTSNPIDVG